MAFGASLKVSNTVQPLGFGPKNGHYRTRELSWLQVPLNASFQISAVFSLRDFSCKASIQNNSISVAQMKRMTEEHAGEFEFSRLTALSPLDGRYWEKVKDLAPFMSEYGLIRFRVLVEVKWLIKLSQIPEVTEVPSFSEEAHSYMEGLINGYGMTDALEVKSIEKVTNHDVKTVEYFLKQKCQSHPEIAKDINNLAHALMLKEAIDTVMFPAIDELIKAICKIAKENANIPMLSCTHGQPASPTTLGKEVAIFAVRLSRERQEISQVKLLGKFVGAVGNYNAHLVAYPDINWPQVAEEFVEFIGLSFNPYVTQITKAGEIGSSTMPHKVNPIDFENSEGNLGKANGGLSHLSMKLPISRWQNDLTDSTVLRNMGEGLGHSLLAYKSALQGILKLQVNEARLREDLDHSWGVLVEPIQTVMRRYGVPEPYEKLKDLTRGRAVTEDSIREFIEGLELPEEAKTILLKLSPCTYVGAAAELAKSVDMALNLVNGIKVL